MEHINFFPPPLILTLPNNFISIIWNFVFIQDVNEINSQNYVIGMYWSTKQKGLINFFSISYFNFLFKIYMFLGLIVAYLFTVSFELPHYPTVLVDGIGQWSPFHELIMITSYT